MKNQKTGFHLEIKGYKEQLELQVASPHVDYDTVIRVCNSLGVLYRNLGNYRKALEYFEKPIIIRQKNLTEDSGDLLFSYYNIMCIQKIIGYFDSAEETGAIVEKLSRKFGIPEGLSRDYDNLRCKPDEDPNNHSDDEDDNPGNMSMRSKFNVGESSKTTFSGSANRHREGEGSNSKNTDSQKANEQDGIIVLDGRLIAQHEHYKLTGNVYETLANYMDIQVNGAHEPLETYTYQLLQENDTLSIQELQLGSIEHYPSTELIS